VFLVFYSVSFSTISVFAAKLKWLARMPLIVDSPQCTMITLLRHYTLQHTTCRGF